MPAARPSRPPILDRSGPVACTYRPPCTVACTIQAAPSSLDEALYREAEVRRQRRQLREDEAWQLAQQQSRPKLGRNSRALCQNRLERELRAIFIQILRQDLSPEQLAQDGTESEVQGQTGVNLSVPRSRLPMVLESLGLLGEAAEEELCEKLGYLLDRDGSGIVTFESFLAFLHRAVDREGPSQSPRPQAASLEEECFFQLEQELLRSLGRLLPNRHTRPKSPGRSATPSPAASARSFPAFHSDAVAEVGGSSRGSRRPAEEVPARSSRPQSVPCSARGRSGEAATTPRSRPLSANAKKTGSRSGTGGEAGISRCHLLYHQAVFASRESAQLEEEIKVLRQKEEMRECTFRPKLTSARRSSSAGPPGAQPRNYETAVARMRIAYQQKLQRQEENEHIPCGENYERLRRLGTQPFSFSSKDKARALQGGPPLMYIDVNVGHGRTGRITVREGDDLRHLAQGFARTFHLDREMAAQLEEMLQEAYLAHTQAASKGDTAGLTASPAEPQGSSHRCQKPLPDERPSSPRLGKETSQSGQVEQFCQGVDRNG